MSQRVDKEAMACNKPRRTPGHPDKSHVVKACYDGKEKIIRFGEQGASTAGKPKAGESERMTKKRASFKARHAKNIAKGPSSAAYWANRVKWAQGGAVELRGMLDKYSEGGSVKNEYSDLIATLTGGAKPSAPVTQDSPTIRSLKQARPQRRRKVEPTAGDYARSVGSSVTSLPGAPKASFEFGQRLGTALPGMIGAGIDYFSRSSPGDVASDVGSALKNVAGYVADNPVSTVADFIPFVGEAKQYAETIQDAARRRALGDLAGAYNLEVGAIPLAAASLIPGIGEARGVVKAARAAEEAVDVARAAERVAPSMVKVEGRELPVIYRGSNVDPMETHAKSRAAWFSSSPEVASSYATSPEGSRVTPMVLDVGNNLLLEIDAGGKPFYGVDPYTLVADADEFEEMVRRYDLDPDAMLTTDQLAQIAADSGYKGARIRNVVDPGHGEAFAPGEGVADTYAIFDPSILKPAIPYMGAPKPTIGTKIMKRAASFPVDYGRPLGNINLRPNIDPVTLKGAEVQDIDSLINQLRGRPGVTKEGLEQVARQFEPGERVSLAQFGERLPRSQYSKVDLSNAAESDLEHALQEASDRLADDPEPVFSDLAYRMGFQNNPVTDLELLHSGDIDMADPEVVAFIRKEFPGADPVDVVQDMYYDSFVTLRNDLASEFQAPSTEYAYRHHQRLVPISERYNPGYFEIGVTHPEIGDLDFEDVDYRGGHYPYGENLAGHIRGTFNPESLLSGVTHGFTPNPNSMVIEELQSDVAKKFSDVGALDQIHGTLFKGAIQHALENGVDTVYLPTAKTVASVRGMNPKQFERIYNGEVIKYGLNPLKQVPGVTVTPIDDMYHEITISPEARDRILKGAGQKAPGYAEGGLVSSYDEAKIADLADQIREGIYG